MTAATPSATLDAGHDRHRTCPQARWSISAERRAEYGIPGLPTCATVDADPGEAGLYSTAYHLVCCLSGQTRRGRRHDVANAMQQTRHWLDSVDCPGQIGLGQERAPSNP